MANQNQGHNQDGIQRSGTSNRGFASMDGEQQREIARLGGMAVSENREHMAAIGRKGGEASAESRANERARNAGASRQQSSPQARADDDVDSRNLGGRSRDDGEGNGRTLSGRSRSDDDDDTTSRRNPGGKDRRDQH
jgi:general stress protein YciG